VHWYEYRIQIRGISSASGDGDRDGSSCDSVWDRTEELDALRSQLPNDGDDASCHAGIQRCSEWNIVLPDFGSANDTRSSSDIA
jgi:hypothetical protein